MPGTVMYRYSYPKPPGDQPYSMLDVPGPASYTAIGIATPPTGGQLLNASDFGLQSMDYIQGMGSDNGQYDVVCIPLGFTGGNAFTQARLQWVLSATGAEAAGAANLSARTVRVMAIGH